MQFRRQDLEFLQSFFVFSSYRSVTSAFFASFAASNSSLEAAIDPASRRSLSPNAMLRIVAL